MRGSATFVDRSSTNLRIRCYLVNDPLVVTCEAWELRRFASAVLCRLGMSTEDAQFMADVIVDSDLAGHESHGMRRLAEYVKRWRDGKVIADATPTIELDTGAVARLNGGSGFGQLVMRDATDLAVARAKVWGIAAIAVRRSSHAGRYANFCERAANLGVAILFFVNDAGAGQDVAPPGALHPRLATNPIAFGIPRARAPHLVLDMSTSVVAAGRVAEWRDRGEPIPAQWVNETGALRPVGGLKGFGLALVAEALAGALTGAGTVAANPEHDDQGVLVIALDITRLRPLDAFATEVEQFITYVRDVPLEHGAPPIRIPGESTHETARQREADGVPVREFTWRALQTLAVEFDVQPPASVQEKYAI